MQGKSAIVTGAARGIGYAIARALAHRGASVVLADVDTSAVEQAVSELLADNNLVSAFTTDVSNETQVQAMAGYTLDKYGRIDILVNNAGICPITPLDELTAAEWDRVMAINLKGAFLCSQAVVPTMRRQGSGKIINIASSAGQMGGLAVGLHYSASKAGLFGLTKGLARILAPHIQVNAVSPGTTESDLTKDWSQDALQSIVSKIPAGRLGQPADVAAAVCFLASAEADFITGQTLSVNGGLLMA